jgi:peptidoglycan/xylan/chitin deacetylase (PgdA/CDA1 family)
LTRTDAFAAPWGERVRLDGQTARLSALDRTFAHLKRLPHDDLLRTVDALLERLGVTDEQDLKNLMLAWDDVQALTGLGFSLGAHTVNHPILARVSRQRAWTEILGSRTMIEAACGKAPRAFAYPNGGLDDYTAATTRLVREAGFTCAVTTTFGMNTPATSPYELRRGGPWETHLPTFALKLLWHRMAA